MEPGLNSSLNILPRSSFVRVPRYCFKTDQSEAKVDALARYRWVRFEVVFKKQRARQNIMTKIQTCLQNLKNTVLFILYQPNFMTQTPILGNSIKDISDTETLTVSSWYYFENCGISNQFRISGLLS